MDKETLYDRWISDTSAATFNIRSSHFASKILDSTNACCLSNSTRSSSFCSCWIWSIWSFPVLPIPGSKSISMSICLDLTTISRASSLRSSLNFSEGTAATCGSLAFGSLPSGTKSCELLM